MSRTRVVALGIVLLAATASNAFADATLFLGTNTTPANRLAKGFAIGMGVTVLGFEFEYSGTSQDAKAAAPSLDTGMVNLLVQTPIEVFGIQAYLTGGVGLYREKLDTLDFQETNVGANLGGGVKVGLMGPVRLRLDYRLFKLAGGALNSPAHRIYAGLNVKF